MEEGLDMARLSLIDVSSADDSLIDGDLPLLPCSDFSKKWDEPNCFESHEDVCDREAEKVAPPEPNRTRKVSKCNLRKSLAWDSAFFTNEGVLDSEELALVNKTFKKAEPPKLPGIQEETQRSFDSSSTLDGGDIPFRNLEVDTCDCVQKVIENVGDDVKIPDTKCGNNEARPSLKESSNSGSSTKRSLTQGRMKQVPVSKKCFTPKHGLDPTSKGVVIQLVEATRHGESKSSLKPPKFSSQISKPASIAMTKKLSANSRIAKTTPVKGLPDRMGYLQPAAVSQKHISTDSCSVRSTPSPKSSSSGSPCSYKQLSSLSSISLERSGSASSDSIAKSPLRIVRNKFESRTTSLSSYLMSNSQSSLSISPASSVDAISETSSTSTNHGSHYSKPCNDIDSLPLHNQIMPCADIQNETALCPCEEQTVVPENVRNGLFCVSVEKQSNRSSVSSAVVHGSNKGGIQKGGHCIKPTGLRMPSPKIGFFDAANIPPGHSVSTSEEKSRVHSTIGGQQSQPGMQTSVPRNATGLGISDVVKVKVNKIQSTRAAAQSQNVFSGSHHSGPSHASSSSTSRPAAPARLAQRIPKQNPRASDAPKISEKRLSMSLKAWKGSSARNNKDGNFENTQNVTIKPAESFDRASSSDLSEEKNQQEDCRGDCSAENQVSSMSNLNVPEENSPLGCSEAKYGFDLGKISSYDTSSIVSSEESLAQNMDFSLPRNRKNGDYLLSPQYNAVVSLDTESKDHGEIFGRNGNCIDLKPDFRYVLSLPVLEVNELDKSDTSRSSSSYLSEPSSFNHKLDALQSSSELNSLPVRSEFMSSGKSPLAINYSLCKWSENYEQNIELHSEKSLEKKSAYSLREKASSLIASGTYPPDTVEKIGQENIILKVFNEDDVHERVIVPKDISCGASPIVSS
ncbi:uncharacterized protein LOC18433080 [Amborella trichopoda]|uniref:Uncharacterized protein n=1 Tax=Amborella trichopoda TaxID=13333 RepID=W1PCZ0_AMBTC|nr:uncharacterized protein LOC18433080 [Amborella trichopoda]ERN04915.1 hypothetical protein AMTR_s00080p00083910 [Amborella trichopoda]|eukprot:XP_006843240.1 uncharacterized protein LOC18433080 [Amborella trichopoda]